jgi:hypothetical protein
MERLSGQEPESSEQSAAAALGRFMTGVWPVLRQWKVSAPGQDVLAMPEVGLK